MKLHSTPVWKCQSWPELWATLGTWSYCFCEWERAVPQFRVHTVLQGPVLSTSAMKHVKLGALLPKTHARHVIALCPTMGMLSPFKVCAEYGQQGNPITTANKSHLRSSIHLWLLAYASRQKILSSSSSWTFGIPGMLITERKKSTTDFLPLPRLYTPVSYYQAFSVFEPSDVKKLLRKVVKPVWLHFLLS